MSGAHAHGATAFGLLLAVGAGFGLAPALVRFAVTGGLPPMGYMFWMGSGAALLSLVLARARGVRPRFGRAHLVYYLCSGWTRIVFAGFVMYTVLGHVPAGVVAILVATSPLMTYFVRLMLAHERFALRRAVGIGLGLAGVGFLVVPISALPDPAMLRWLTLGFAVPVLYTFSNMTIERLRPPGEDSIALTAGMLVTVAATSGVLAVAIGQFHPLWEGGISLREGAMLIHAVVMAGCFFGLYELVRKTDATFGSQISYVSTISGVVFGIVLLGERPSLWVWVAVGCILGGIALATPRPAPTRRGAGPCR